MTIRAKMQLEDIVRTTWGQKKVFFRCAYSPDVTEDVSFCKATPSGDAQFVIDNPKATEQLIIGAYYYVDFSPVD